METLFAINQYVIQFGTGLGLLLALMEWLKHGTRALRRAVFYLGLVMAQLQLRLGLILSGIAIEEPRWLMFFFAGTLAFGPVIFWLMRNLADFALPDRNWLAPALWFLTVAGVVAELWLAAYGRLAEPDFIRSGFADPPLRGSDWLFAATGVYLTGIATGVLVLFVGVWRRYAIQHGPLYLVGILVPTMAELLVHIGYFTNQPGLMHSGSAAVTLWLVLLFVLPARYPEFLESLRQELERQRYAKTSLAGLDLPGLRGRLEALMAEGLYRDDELRLPALAERLGVSANQLSRILNEHYDQSFYEYLNAHRIAAACELLRSDLERTVLSVAYEVGFRSKSTFNAQFLKHTGRTPAQFRRHP